MSTGRDVDLGYGKKTALIYVLLFCTKHLLKRADKYSLERLEAVIMAPFVKTPFFDLLVEVPQSFS